MGKTWKDNGHKKDRWERKDNGKRKWINEKPKPFKRDDRRDGQGKGGRYEN